MRGKSLADEGLWSESKRDIDQANYSLSAMPDLLESERAVWESKRGIKKRSHPQSVMGT